MSSPDVATRPAPEPGSSPVVDVEQAEAALVEHYPRLVRLGYLVLPPSLGRNRRVLTAHSITQRALPRGRTAGDRAVIPAQRGTEGRNGDPGYGYVRLRVLRSALEAGLPLKRKAWPKRSQLPPLLPQVWGLRLFPRSGGADELALDQRLSALGGPARAAYVLRGLERLPDAEVRKVLAAAGVEDPHAALAEADGVPMEHGLLDSPEFDPCSLQARPTDLMRRRQHTRAALAAAAAALVCGALLGLPGDGWGPDGAAAPPYAKNPAAEAALDPGKLTRAAPQTWQRSARTDFSVWPARGSLTGDRELLRRALAVWARPGESVQVSATPGTPAGAPPGPAQLLYAGEVDEARVVLLHDGLRIVRYAEPRDGEGGAALDFARVDGAEAGSSSAVVVDRVDGNVRYLTAPWVRDAAVRDLLKPADGPRTLRRSKDGVTDPLPTAASATICNSVSSLELRDAGGTRLLTDLGELTPAHLTAGRPDAPREVSGQSARASWARTACLLPAVRSHGVRSVNSWAFANQRLPESNGTATWVCTRAETWRGGGSRVLAQFQAPGKRTGAIAAKAQDSPACGVREPRVLAGVLWKSRAGSWHVLAAGSKDITSVTATGGAPGSARGNVLDAPAKKGARAELTGKLADGTSISSLR
ncbi:hypothetical protein ACFQVC_36680 [Streptomyces monticola]|uniref:DNA-directed RNA polymerase specialized sigma24 family protein n=1 Tax=Streptomyces monticola TaxID=2666263 RepID=A0ABW2JW97_9ACTN